MCGRDADLKKTYGIITTLVIQRSSNRFYYLEPRFKTNCKENELYIPIQQNEAYE